MNRTNSVRTDVCSPMLDLVRYRLQYSPQIKALDIFFKLPLNLFPTLLLKNLSQVTSEFFTQINPCNFLQLNPSFFSQITPGVICVKKGVGEGELC